MSLNFVASAVLTTTNGLDHKEEEIENEEVAGVRRNARDSSSIGLFDQLQKNKDDKDAEWEEKVKRESVSQSTHLHTRLTCLSQITTAQRFDGCATP